LLGWCDTRVFHQRWRTDNSTLADGWNIDDVLIQACVPIISEYILFSDGFEGDPLSNDSDGDRLPDSVETNTGVFIDANNTGTDPNIADTDGGR
jgi:hypothetical protein